jgi:excisionase family DNA binding protein
MPETDRLLSIDETCEQAHFGRTTFWRLVGSGELRAVKVGRSVRVRESDLLAWFESLPEVAYVAARARAAEAAD